MFVIVGLVSVMLVILWYKLSKTIEKFDPKLNGKRILNSEEYNMVRNYHKKPEYKRRVILIIEKFDGIDRLLIGIKNILNQTIKVSSIVLISSDNNMKKVDLIHKTCIINKVGGFSLSFKETGFDTILLFIFPEGFKAFKDPHFLREYLTLNKQINGIVKLDKEFISIKKVY